MKAILWLFVVFYSISSNAQFRPPRPQRAPLEGPDWSAGCVTCQRAIEQKALEMELLNIAGENANEAERHKQKADELEAQGDEGAASNARALSQDYQNRAQGAVDGLTSASGTDL